MKTKRKFIKQKKTNNFRKTRKIYKNKTRKSYKKNHKTKKYYAGTRTKFGRTFLKAFDKNLRSNLTKEIKKDFYKIMNKYDEVSDPLYHIPMDEYGRYLSKPLGEGVPKPGDINPYESHSQEGWKKFKLNRGTEEFFRQGVQDRTDSLNTYFYGDKDKKEEEKKEEEKKEEEDIQKIDEIIEESPDSSKLNTDISNFGKTFFPSLPISSFGTNYRKQLEIDYLYQLEFNKKLIQTFEKIQNEPLKQQLIQYNNETKDQENINFNGWINAANKVGYDFLKATDKQKEEIIQTTAESMAIIKYRVVQLANSAYNIGASIYNRGTSAYDYSIKVIPKGVITTYNIIDYGTLQNICAMVSMSEKFRRLFWQKPIDWTDQKNLDDFNKNLVSFLDRLILVIFKKLLEQRCNNVIPKILKKVIHPKSVDKIVNFIKGEAITNPNIGLLVDNSTDFCNKIIPAVSEHFKKNGFNQGIGEECSQQLKTYLNTSLSLVKEILWDVLQNTASKAVKSDSSAYVDEVFGNREIIYSFSDQEKRKMYDEIFDITSVNNVAKNLGKIAEEIYSDIEGNIDQAKIDQAVQELNTQTIPQEISEEENNLKENIEGFIQDKVKISDFITDLFGAIKKLGDLWYIESKKYDFDNGDSEIDCLLNIVDLRINTLLMETCTVYAKGLLPEEICNEKFYKIIQIFNDKPISDIDKDAFKNTIKNIIIDAMIENMKNKTMELKDEFIEKYGNPTKMFIFAYAVIKRRKPPSELGPINFQLPTIQKYKRVGI